MNTRLEPRFRVEIPLRRRRCAYLKDSHLEFSVRLTSWLVGLHYARPITECGYIERRRYCWTTITMHVLVARVRVRFLSLSARHDQ